MNSLWSHILFSKRSPTGALFLFGLHNKPGIKRHKHPLQDFSQCTYVSVEGLIGFNQTLKINIIMA